MGSLAPEHFVTARAGLNRRAMDSRAQRFGRPIDGSAFPDPDVRRPGPRMIPPPRLWPFI